MQNTLAGFNQGIRRMDRECIVAWCCYPAAGVISSSKQHFLLQQVTSLCHSNPKSLVGVVVMPNRAGDLRAPGTKILSLHYIVFLTIRHPFKNIVSHKHTLLCVYWTVSKTSAKVCIWQDLRAEDDEEDADEEEEKGVKDVTGDGAFDAGALHGCDSVRGYSFTFLFTSSH